MHLKYTHSARINTCLYILGRSLSTFLSANLNKQSVLQTYAIREVGPEANTVKIKYMVVSRHQNVG